MTRARGSAGARTRAGVVAVLLSALAVSSTALGNGRYARSQQLLTDPSDSERLWLRATYGVLTSADHGNTWKYICETALGISDGEDPSMVVTADGTLLVGGSTGLFVTTDHGCTFGPHPDISEYVVDLTTANGGASVLALTGVIEPSGASDLFVWRSDDAGRRFTKLGAMLATDLFGMTLDAAPSDPSRLYVTAVPAVGKNPVDPTTPGTLLRSLDSGATWERLPISGTTVEIWPLIAAIHPTKPDTVYVRVRGASDLDAPIRSWLLVSDDAGTTFREVFRGNAEMFGFAFGDAPGSLLIGLGDSYDLTHQRPVDRSALGVYRAATADSSWDRALLGQVGCLRQVQSGLYVCSTHESLGMELGLSTDEGATVAKVLDFGKQIALPECADGGSPTVCADLWSSLCRTIGPCAAPTTVPARAAGASGGCTCRTSSPHEAGPSTWLLVLGAIAAASVRRARMRRHQSCT